MKKYLLLVLLSICTFAYSQNRIDPASVISGFTPQTIFNFNADSLHFIKGWNWSSESSKLDDALLMNFNHTGILPNFNDTNTLHNEEIPYLYANGQNWIIAIDKIRAGDRHASITQAQALHYEPSMVVDTSDNFIPMTEDNTGAVFGFKYRHPDFVNDQNISHNFVLRQSVLSSIQQDSAVVLNSVWADDELKEIVNMDNDVIAIDEHMPFNGYHWYLSLRIRPLEQIDSSNANDNVLTIRMPYKTLSISGGDSTWDDGFISFDEIPTTGLSANDTVSIYSVRATPEYLGMTRNLQILNTDRTRFFLKANMLRTQEIDNNQEYITLSAFFRCEGPPPLSPNPFLQNHEHKGVTADNIARITNLGIQVMYNGNVDVAIDWIRIETPQYQNLARGQFDQEIIDTIQNRIETLFFFRPDIKIWRFYGIDEFWTSNWMSQRYLNKLLGGNVTSELDHFDIQAGRMLHATDFKEFWKGQSCTQTFDSNCAAPYVRKTFYSDSMNKLLDVSHRIGLRNGYVGKVHWNINYNINRDTLNSYYESYIDRSHTINDNNLMDSVHSENIHELEWKSNNTLSYNFSSPLMLIEHQLYKEYYKTGSMLFNDKSFIPNIWLQSGWNLNNGEFFYFRRPLTGEELRYAFTSNIILGAKGLISYYGCSGYYQEDIQNIWHWGESGLSGLKKKTLVDSIQNNMPTSWELLYGDYLGGDFIGNPDITEVPDNTNIDRSLDYYIKPDVVEWDSLKITKDRVYIGRSSLRVETGKINRWIAEVEDELLNLKLQAWKAKGFKQWYCQHPNLSDNYINKFISIDTSDWKYFRTNPTSNNLQWIEQCWDSAFFDLTLLKDKTKGIDTVFYIGIQNRRTDPLIYTKDTISYIVRDEEYGETEYSYLDEGMRFYTTAELDSNVRYGGNKYYVPPDSTSGNFTYEFNRFCDTTYWRNLWWKRLGCREIHIPFDFINQSDSTEYCLLKVTELGGDLYKDNPTEWWWRAPQYYNYIDTTIGQDRDLVVRLLPGEGKILKVEVLHPDKVAGYLDHSNQSKLVGFPVYDGTRKTDSIRYHLTYFKPISTGNDTMGVYYRRSKIISGNSSSENIEWEDEICVSRTFTDNCICYNCPTNARTVRESCNYPSIVVRKKNDSTVYAYIVYTCENPYQTVEPWDYLVESIIEANGSDSITLNNLVSSKAIAGFGGWERDKVNWGNPVINASYGGNYYAWSDSLDIGLPNRGAIIVGYKSLNYAGDCLEAKDTLMWSTGNHAQHPSLNVYSLIESGEDNCSLVWQEKYLFDNRIFYTRLKYENGILKHLLAPVKKSVFQTNGDSIALLKFGLNSSFPVIYRSVAPTNLINPPPSNGNNWISNRHERIFWEEEYNILIDEDMQTYKQISSCDMYHRDSSGVFKEIKKIGNNVVSGVNIDLLSPNVSQLAYINFPTINLSLDVINLNLNGDNRIYSLNLYYSYLQDSFGSYNSTPGNYISGILNEIVHVGELPHLSKNPESNPVTNDITLWKNRRVFNGITGNPPDILSSAKSFYRQSDEENVVDGFAGYSNNNFYYYVGKAYLEGELLPWILPFESVEDTIINMSFPVPVKRDSIYTDHFYVFPFTSADIDFTVYGFNSSSATIGLEGHPSNTFIAFQIPESTPGDEGQSLHFTITNMSNCEYRLIFINHDTTAEYSERLFIGGLPISDTLLAKHAENYGGRIIIDLETGQTRKLKESGKMELKVFPNPAKDEVFVTVNYPVKYLIENSDRINKVKVRLFSITGEKLFEYLARPGETIKIPTSEFTQGTYFIQAEEKIDKWQLDYLAPAVERVFIQR